MPRLTERLTAVRVKQIDDRGWYPDGLGLYLQVSASRTKSWVYRYTRNGKQRWHGLGSVSALNNLKNARANAETCRQQLREGKDPIDTKLREKEEQLAAAANSITFSECASKYIEAHKHGWKNPKTEAQWISSLDTYAHPVIGDLAVQTIDAGLVTEVVGPIWTEKTETARRVRQRIELVLDWATVRGFRKGENPARWRGHLERLLANPAKVRPVKHHPALAFDELPNLYSKLESIENPSALALRWIILTASRSSEARLSTWSEIDLKNQSWNIAAERMKNGKPHRVPLASESLAILRQLPSKDSEFLFPGRNGGGITEAAVRKLVKQLSPGITIHGFRSTFRDWAAERTNYPREIAEIALSHNPGTATEMAYQRSDLFEKRGQLMEEWSTYCASCVH